MFIKTFTVPEKNGVTIQLAIKLTHLASQFMSDVYLEYKGRKANLKSILGIISLGISPGTDVTITTHGLDEYEAIRAIGATLEQEMAGV